MPGMAKMFSTMNEPVTIAPNIGPATTIRGSNEFLSAWTPTMRLRDRPFARAIRTKSASRVSSSVPRRSRAK
jgi:hypothetical protein